MMDKMIKNRRIKSNFGILSKKGFFLAYMANTFNYANGKKKFQFQFLKSPIWMTLKNYKLSRLGCRCGRMDCRGLHPCKPSNTGGSDLPRWT
jgi:hypothetical protein